MTDGERALYAALIPRELVFGVDDGAIASAIELAHDVVADFRAIVVDGGKNCDLSAEAWAMLLEFMGSEATK